jgi:hypothetical protein
MMRADDRRRMVSLAITWVAALVVSGLILGGLALIAQQRAASCAAHGWATTQTRGMATYCVDEHGLVRAP